MPWSIRFPAVPNSITAFWPMVTSPTAAGERVPVLDGHVIGLDCSWTVSWKVAASADADLDPLDQGRSAAAEVHLVGSRRHAVDVPLRSYVPVLNRGVLSTKCTSVGIHEP